MDSVETYPRSTLALANQMVESRVPSSLQFPAACRKQLAHSERGASDWLVNRVAQKFVIAKCDHQHAASARSPEPGIARRMITRRAQ
ncbi:MAG: hypothetical protein M3505_07915, partial [Verrucomicrobiota bacterium]|nr:hypothetical protein [Verrucomicrobiota bacterium]